MTSQSTTTRTELAHRRGDGIEVTLVWVHGGGEDGVVVTVHSSRDGSSFEIPAERHLALDVYYHPFAYSGFSSSGDDHRPAEVVR
jgi:hypothetical protein